MKTYHEFSYPHEMLLAIKKSLKLKGQLVIVESAKEGSYSLVSTHVMRRRQIKKELTANGFRLIRLREALPDMHFMVFEKSK